MDKNKQFHRLNPKPAACKASTLPLIYDKMICYCLSLNGCDHNFPFPVECCHIMFNCNYVFHRNNASANISRKNICILKFWKDLHCLD